MGNSVSFENDILCSNACLARLLVVCVCMLVYACMYARAYVSVYIYTIYMLCMVSALYTKFILLNGRVFLLCPSHSVLGWLTTCVSVFCIVLCIIYRTQRFTRVTVVYDALYFFNSRFSFALRIVCEWVVLTTFKTRTPGFTWSLYRPASVCVCEMWLGLIVNYNTRKPTVKYRFIFFWQWTCSVCEQFQSWNDRCHQHCSYILTI